MAYEMLAGTRPFPGPGDQYRQQHLHEVPARLQNVSVSLGALVAECLQKQPETRPTADEVVRRLKATGGSPRRPSLSRLQEAHEAEVSQRASEQGRAAVVSSEQERRELLFADARNSFATIAHALRDALVEAAPSIERVEGGGDRWALKLGEATLRLSEPTQQVEGPEQLPFDVVAYASLSLQGHGSLTYRGRSHSLWYCDAEKTDRFAWYEVAFMQTVGGSGSIAPFALTPSEGAIAFRPVMGTKQLARSLRPVSTDELDAFVSRWGGWFADAYHGYLSHPSQLPEESIQKNYRDAP